MRLRTQEKMLNRSILKGLGNLNHMENIKIWKKSYISITTNALAVWAMSAMGYCCRYWLVFIVAHFNPTSTCSLFLCFKAVSEIGGLNCYQFVPRNFSEDLVRTKSPQLLTLGLVWHGFGAYLHYFCIHKLS